MSKGAVAERNREMAKYMKEHPGRFPDSTVRPWPGNGSDIRKIASQMGTVLNQTSAWERGMLGGVLAAKLGYGAMPNIANF